MTRHCEESRQGGTTNHLAGSPHRLPPVRDDIFAQAKPRQVAKPAVAPQVQPAGAWRVVLLNDPVNRMSYVVMVLRRVFGFAEEDARRHMLEVHESGRSVVWAGTREQAEAHMFALQQWHLTAVIQADEA
jgi:ATP-dependent Clp protease adaptor protein ClpS